jgi:Eukaryotic aspartyl protease
MTTAPSGEAPIKNIRNWVYLTEVHFGGQLFVAVIDTGSADTWLVGSGFRCIGSTGAATNSAVCKFGKSYVKTPSYVAVTEQKFSTRYADGEVLQGDIGRETVTLGGITVKNQTVGIVNTANWKGDGQSSGLIGMAFPSVTRALSSAKAVRYDPIFFNMYKHKLIEPVFSVALNRPEEGAGALALGGLPGPHIKHDGKWARVPMEHLSIKSPTPQPEKEQDFSLYAVKAQRFEVNGKSIGGPARVLIDSGTTMSYLPSEVVDAMAKAFVPAPISMLGNYAVQCNAKAPKFGIVFNGTSIHIDGKDLILNQGFQTGGICMLSVQGSASAGLGKGMSILGGPFMKSVISVFDVGAAEIRFASRVR